MKRNNLIGAALITKNAEDSIASTILSLKEFCNQIVVVDTGSTDSTASICSRLGCEVHFFKWVDDFSIARNYALKKMRTDWILSIDSDEIFDAVIDFSLLNNPKIGGLNLKIINYLDENNPNLTSEHRYTRIFRNHPDIKFEGRIHEQIRDSIEGLELEIIDTELLIRHYGYSHQTTDKQARNQHLLENELEKNTMDDYLTYHLANTEFSLKNYDKSKELFLRIVNSFELSEDQVEMAKLRLAQIALNFDEISEIKKWTNFISQDVNREGFRQYLISIGMIIEGQHSLAASLLESDKIMLSSFVDKKLLSQTKEFLQKNK